MKSARGYEILGRTTEPGDPRRVWLLGALRIEDEQGPIPLPGPKAQSLFAFLVLHPDVPHTREALADLLWPDAPPDRVRRNLTNLLHRLRKALGPGWLTVEGDRIALRTGADLWVDTWEFEQLSTAEDTASLQQAVALYTGDLLPEIYDDWAVMQRVALHEKYLTCLLRLGQMAEQQGDLEAAFEHFHHLAHADPLREEAHRGLMRSLAGMGRLADALAAYAELERVLDRELGVPPAEETRALAERLQAELELTRATAPGGNVFARPPFVGRTAERAQLLARLDQAQAGRGGILTLLGEAGSGKTRLLEEIADAAGWRGWQVAWGRGEELGRPAPYTPLRQALAQALPTPRWGQLSRLVQPVWLMTVARLVLHHPDLLDEAAIAQLTPDRRQLSTAIRRLLGGLGQITPHLLILDDVQWADPTVWSLLDELRAPLNEMAVLLVVSGRTDELRAQPARSTLQAWDRAGEPPIRLSGLDSGELADLVSACGLDDYTPAQVARLSTASGGNPLLALALLQARDLERIPVRPSLVELTLRRLAGLSDDARRALETAAVIGYQFDYALWEAMLEREGLLTDIVPALAGELERAGLIRLEADAYRFAHDTLRAAVYAHMPEPDRQRWHEGALSALRRLAPDDPLPLLHHAEQAGATAQAARYDRQAGEQALAAFSYRSARSYLEQALAWLPPDDLAGRYAAALGLARALDVLAEREAQRQAVNMLRDLADELDDDRRRAEAAWHQASLEWITGDFVQAQAVAEAGLVLVRSAEDVRQQALLLEIMGRAARDLGDYARASQCFTQARTCYVQLGDEPGVAWMDGMLGVVAQRQGRLQEAIAYHTRAMNAARQAGNLFNELRAASGLATTLWMAGDYPQARAIFQRTLTLSREVGDHRMEEASLANLGGLADILGDYETAVALKEQALALSRAADNRMGVALGLCNLGITYYKLGQLDRSLAAFDEAITIDRSTGRQQGEAYSLHGRGVTLLELGRIAEARASLEQARVIRKALGEQDVLAATLADLAVIALAEGDLAWALEHIETALDTLQPDYRADLHEQVHYAAYRVLMAQGKTEAALEHLRQAEAAMWELAGSLPSEARARFLEHDPLNRRVRAALDTHARRVQVRLVRADVPLGRQLTEADYTLVTWTLHTPADDRFRKKAERRRHILQRLLAEAAAQGVAPTDDDLAQVLGVSRRTVLRDMEVLSEEGVSLPTRRRRGEIGD